jgi:hypothetical protein
MSAIILEDNEECGVQLILRSQMKSRTGNTLVVRIYKPGTDETIERQSFKTRHAADSYYVRAVSAHRDATRLSARRENHETKA